MEYVKYLTGLLFILNVTEDSNIISPECRNTVFRVPRFIGPRRKPN